MLNTPELWLPMIGPVYNSRTNGHARQRKVIREPRHASRHIYPELCFHCCAEVLLSLLSVHSACNMSDTTIKIKEALPPASEVKDEVIEASKGAVSSLRSFAAGGVGGICAVIVGHPFDLVKVRMQTAERGVYTGAFDVVRKTIAREGMRKGLYAGVSAPLVGVTPMCETIHYQFGRYVN